ncbi:hypothetical protein HV461_15410 [Bacillus sporothermodurans]|uniref:hypothetical protein n=1 Tax=Heyndrickxia sporothermodurans TaxID=46224 RepID=UPI0013FD8D1A|nr:hypothetical protein [Heyndrickxia sporothermodurans]MBL5772539.1 hypothetical protein [Heyndrickxia sporothermodurans]MBL5812007.1 hypothetical protein [Heyndrickxia sporothermodurans]MBL5832723.1 hypothetical protein [Heyndrickxia sporothermodurans]MBL5867458.1 hypothetical protein [Heyndrickxia sporothermodurans]MBL5881507.1 hypothetical protein [Heyndrickxia sporothermodurans]
MDWSGRYETPAGLAGQMRHRGERSDEEAHRRTAKKRVPVAERNGPFPKQSKNGLSKKL